MVDIPKRTRLGYIKEEEIQQDASANTQQQSNQSAAQKYALQIANLRNQLMNKQKEFDDYKNNISKQIMLITNQAAKEGVVLSQTSESVNYQFSVKLYESLTQESNIEMLATAFQNTFEKLVGQLSYYFDKKGCLTWAKEFNSWLNDARLGWYRNEDHWADVEKELDRYMGKSKSRFLEGDKKRFIEGFRNEIQNGEAKNVFGWIFGGR